jgi:uroporphyrinogen-III decarboxylase
MLVGVMDYELVLEWVLDRPDLIHRLADTWLERTWAKVEFLLSQGVGPFWHFNGVERASPPMMGRRQWDELVVPYDGEIMRRIKARDPAARIHVHCHGRVATLLDSWLSLGVDSIDPVEPPPQGDLRMEDARKRVGEKMTLYGNLEFAWMERESPRDIERHVREAIAEGGKERLVLAPSATPHQRQTATFTANAERYILAALEAGAR